MKKILLLPTYYYLSNPVYQAMKELLEDQDFEFIYFFNKDNTFIKENLKNITYDKVGKHFDHYIELEFNPPWVTKLNDPVTQISKPKALEITHNDSVESIYRSRLYWYLNHPIKMVRHPFRIMQYIKRIYQSNINYYGFITYLKEFTKTIEKISPDIIITTGDLTLSCRIIRKFFPETKLIIIQPCFLDFREKAPKKVSFNKKVLHWVSGNVLYPKQQYFGLESSNDHLLLFEDKFLEFYTDKRTNNYKIVNPFFYKLNQNISVLKNDDKRKEFCHKINIDSCRKNIIVFVSDYTNSHGEDIQQYTETAYINIIKHYSNDFNFIIKNHPRAGIKNFEVHFEGIPNVHFLTDELQYEELLALGDLNISINSNASLECVVCGMPTINFLPLHLSENDHFKWLSFYGGSNAHSYEEIVNLLETFKTDHDFFTAKVNEGRIKLIGKEGECKERLLDILNTL
jgi:hypothetical protein